MNLNKEFYKKAYKVFYFEIFAFVLLTVFVGFCCIWKRDWVSVWRSICVASIAYSVLMWMHIRFLINYTDKAVCKQHKFQLKSSLRHVRRQKIMLPTEKTKHRKTTRKSKIGNAMILCFGLKIIFILLISIPIIYSRGAFSLYSYCATILFGYLVWVFAIIYEFYFNYKQIKPFTISTKQKYLSLRTSNKWD